MLPNVWSVDEFKKHSSKLFSSRSPQLQAIDNALKKAHQQNPSSEAGTMAMVELLEAIASWRKFKQAQGKTSGRARAIDTLQSQLADAAEKIYQRKIGEQKKVDQQMAAAKAGIQQNIQNLGLGQGKVQFPKVPTPPIPTHQTPQQLQNHLQQGLQQQRAKMTGQPMPPSPMPMPQRSASQDRLFDHLASALIEQRRKVMAYDDEDLFDDLSASQKGRLAAKWMLAVPNEVKDVSAARAEALRILAAMLGNNVEVIKNLLSSNLEVVVIPRDKGMTALDQFESIRGQLTFDGRSWDSVRGVGNVVNSGLNSQLKEHKQLRELRDSGKKAASIVAIDPAKGRVYTAITEENLLGGLTTAPGGGCYDTGYSTTSHEFAHSVHHYGLSAADRNIVEEAFRHRSKGFDHEEWVDGPKIVNGQKCYAANNSSEYFAQLTNAWLGVNFGPDPYTGKPRNNGKAWVLANEPKMLCDVFERVYGQKALDDLNPAVILKS